MKKPTPYYPIPGKTSAKRYISLLFISLVVLPACALLTDKSTTDSNTTQTIINSGLTTVHTLDVYAEQNHLHALLSGIDRNSQKLALKYIHSRDAGKNWSSPISIDHGQTAIKKSKRGNDFQLAAFKDKLIAVWRSQGAEPWTGKISAALSTDSGQSWQAINSPLGDQFANIDQGYFDLTASPTGHFHFAWLDDREEAGDTQGVRYARLNTTTASWDQHKTLEATACTCCWLDIEADKAGQISLLYRDDSPRDMKIISSIDGGLNWQKARTAADFNWEFIGCPHQGGGLTSTQQDKKTVLHSVVWNGKKEGKGIYYSQSSLSAGKPSILKSIAGNNSSSADIAALNKQHLRVVYTAGNYESKSVMTKFSLDGGLNWSTEQRLSAVGAEPSHPRIIASNTGYHFFWTEWQDNGDALAIFSEIK